MELVRKKAEKRSKAANFTSVFSAVGQKPLWNSNKAQTRQIFSTPKFIQVLGNAEHPMLDMFYQLLDNLGTFLSSTPHELYMQMVVDAGAKKRKKETVAKSLQISVPTKVF